jgi:thymidylate synthase (FAD)
MHVTLLGSSGTDLDVVNAARVSFAKMSNKLSDKDEKLIAYLAKHDHWSPFAHTYLSFHVRAPIFVARQLAKHQVGGAWNEESRRYVSDAPEIYYPGEWRSRPDNIKQGSDEALHPGDGYLADMAYEAAVHEAVKSYQMLLKRGVAPEMARMCLPLSIYTSWRWSGSVLFFSRVCNLRLDDHSQAETRLIAEQIAKICKDKFPVSWKALTGLTTIVEEE